MGEVRRQRRVIEEQTRALQTEVENVRAHTQALRERLHSELASVDSCVKEELDMNKAGLDKCEDRIGAEAKGILRGLATENAQVWAIEDLTAKANMLSGATTLERSWNIRPLTPAAALPFGGSHTPFDGFGNSFGARPPGKPPQGFLEETRQTATQRTALLT